MIKQYFKNFFKWRLGRQETGYYKMLLFCSKIPIQFDMYLLKYPEGSEIPPHTDNIKTGKHYRLNIILKNAKKGGVFVVKNCIFETKRIKFFRPDISEHSVTKIEKGTRILFSLGFVLKKKEN
jgi:hypothetical protein